MSERSHGKSEDLERITPISRLSQVSLYEQVVNFLNFHFNERANEKKDKSYYAIFVIGIFKLILKATIRKEIFQKQKMSQFAMRLQHETSLMSNYNKIKFHLIQAETDYPQSSTWYITIQLLERYKRRLMLSVLLLLLLLKPRHFKQFKSSFILYSSLLYTQVYYLLCC